MPLFVNFVRPARVCEMRFGTSVWKKYQTNKKDCPKPDDDPPGSLSKGPGFAFSREQAEHGVADSTANQTGLVAHGWQKDEARDQRAECRSHGIKKRRNPGAVHPIADAVLKEAEKDLKEIASRFDPAFVQLARPLLAAAFHRLYTSVEVDEAGLAAMKRAATDAPIVLCPSHKSHIDYLVLSWLLYENGMTPPHIAAGINLAFWPFGSIARRGGAFFIRRKVKGDRIYTAVLRAYVKHLLRDRFPQEFYVEGGRSRTGKLLSPKTGLVSMEVVAWLDGAADDVVFVPIAVDYEKLIEASVNRKI